MRITARLKRIAVTASVNLLFIRIISALSMATSVPAPMAIPTSAAAMSLSSLFVVGNALRLRGFKAGERGPAHEAEAEDDAAEAWENAETGESLEAGENACPGQEIEKNNKIEEKQEERNMNKTMIIEGMMCAHCTGRVQKALEAVEGVESVVMSLEEKSAVLTLSSQVEDEALKAAVAEAGYEVTQIRS